MTLALPILEGKTKVVFGNRFHHGLPKEMAIPNKVVNILLAATVRVLFGVRLHDEATCYKLVDTELLKQMNLAVHSFRVLPRSPRPKQFDLAPKSRSYRSAMFHEQRPTAKKSGGPTLPMPFSRYSSIVSGNLELNLLNVDPGLTLR